MLFGDVLRCCLFSIEAAASGSWCPRRKENEELRHQLKQVPSNSIDFQCVSPHVCRKQTWLSLQNNRRHNSSTTAVQHPHAAMNWLVDSKIQEVQSMAFRSVSLFAGESGRRHAWGLLCLDRAASQHVRNICKHLKTTERCLQYCFQKRHCDALCISGDSVLVV